MDPRLESYFVGCAHCARMLYDGRLARRSSGRRIATSEPFAGRNVVFSQISNFRFQIVPFWLWPEGHVRVLLCRMRAPRAHVFPKLCCVNPTAYGLQPAALPAQPTLENHLQEGFGVTVADCFSNVTTDELTRHEMHTVHNSGDAVLRRMPHDW